MRLNGTQVLTQWKKFCKFYSAPAAVLSHQLSIPSWSLHLREIKYFRWPLWHCSCDMCEGAFFSKGDTYPYTTTIVSGKSCWLQGKAAEVARPYIRGSAISHAIPEYQKKTCQPDYKKQGPCAMPVSVWLMKLIDLVDNHNWWNM